MFSSEDIITFISSYMWALVRVTAFVAAAPVISSNSIPAKVKLGFSLVLTLVIVPVVPPPPVVEAISGDALLIVIHQILIGASMGLALQLVFTMFVVGGQVIAYQMGLGFSQMVDPSSGTQVPVVSQFYIIVITLMFFVLNGHLLLVDTLVDSFRTIPVAPNGLSLNGIWSLISWGSNMYAGGVQIALPAIASILLINLTFAVVTRAAPQFNIFTIGFPVTMVMGFFIIMATLSTVLPQFGNQLSNVFELIRTMLKGG